ncbi:unnamed protein product [Coregonus sp. 'balchen']|nr:unnamed protein product [Coregonus sp. 'balchen']
MDATIASELDSEHAQKVLEMEHAQQVKLKERQKYFEEAFQQDMDHMSSMEVNVDVLEQMDLMDVSDHEALDISLRVPTQAELRNKPSSLSSAEPGSASQDTSLGEEGQEGEGSEASGDEPLVLPDEEEVQADTALVALPEAETFKNSDDSDSQAS